MSGPERLLLGGATDFERSLLRAVLDERPSPELTLRMEQALGLGVGALPGATSTAATGHAAAGQGAAVHVAAPSLAAKAGVAGIWIKAGVGALVGAGLVASGVAVQSRVTRAPSAPVVDRSAHQASKTETVPAEAAPVGAPTATAEAVHDEALRDEIGLLDAARAASARGDVHRAREVLARYHREFPHGSLEREARVLWRRSGAGPWPKEAPTEVRPAESAGSEDTPRR